MIRQVEDHFLVDQKDAVEGVFSVSGFSFAGSGQNMGFAFIQLKPWDERTAPGLSVTDVAAKAGAFLRRSVMRRFLHSRRPPYRNWATRQGSIS